MSDNGILPLCRTYRPPRENSDEYDSALRICRRAHIIMVIGVVVILAVSCNILGRQNRDEIIEDFLDEPNIFTPRIVRDIMGDPETDGYYLLS